MALSKRTIGLVIAPLFAVSACTSTPKTPNDAPTPHQPATTSVEAAPTSESDCIEPTNYLFNLSKTLVPGFCALAVGGAGLSSAGATMLGAGGMFYGCYRLIKSAECPVEKGPK